MDGGPSYYIDNVIRISIVNEEGNLVLESLVHPLFPIQESRAFIHGIEIDETEKALDFKILKGILQKLS